jgi:hypothetical protein
MKQMSEARRDELLEACRLLFGVSLDASFLDHVQEPGLKAAWRLKALQTHPDRTIDRAAKATSNERFIEARAAYGLLREYLGRRGLRGDAAPRRPAGPGAYRAGQRPAPRPRPRYASQRPADARPLVAIPRRRLRLGEFLYHSRMITFPALIETLVHQRRQRERFCEIVVRWNYLSPSQVRALLLHRRPLERIGEAAQRLRLLSPAQVRLVLTFQRMCQEPLGKLFVRRGLLTDLLLEEQLARLLDHNASLRRG